MALKPKPIVQIKYVDSNWMAMAEEQNSVHRRGKLGQILAPGGHNGHASSRRPPAKPYKTKEAGPWRRELPVPRQWCQIDRAIGRRGQGGSLLEAVVWALLFHHLPPLPSIFLFFLSSHCTLLVIVIVFGAKQNLVCVCVLVCVGLCVCVCWFVCVCGREREGEE